MTERSPAELAAHVEDMITRTLGDAAPLYRRAPGIRPAPVGPFEVSAPCPVRAAAKWRADEDAGYVDSAANARRRVALVAMHRWLDEGRKRPLPAVIDAVVTDRDGLDPGLQQWLGGLERGGRAAVIDGALTWSMPLASLLASARRVRIPEPSHRFTFQPASVVVRPWARAEASLGRPADLAGGGEWVLLTIRLRDPDADRGRFDAAWLAFCATLAKRRAPTRVAVLEAATGEVVRYPVTTALLEEALDALVGFTRALATDAFASASAGEGTAPGPWCRTCPVLDVCPAGAEQSTRPRVVGGISLSE